MELIGISLKALDVILTSISVVIGFILSFIGIQQTRNARKEIANNRSKMEEEHIMGKLVSYLNNTYLTFCYTVFDSNSNGYSSAIPIVNYNIFEVGRLADYGDTGYFSEKDNDSIMMNRTKYEYDTAKVMFEEGVIKLFDLTQYINNPYMPRTVADELSIFVAMFHEEVELPMNTIVGRNELVLVRPFNNEKHFQMKKAVNVQGDAYKTWSSLKGHSKSLTDAIVKWYNDNHIKNINLRIDYNHTGEL